jgi:anti-repressor protein
MNNDLIKISVDDGVQTVSGRELHEALKIESNYTTWFNRMCEYGFEENVDYAVCFPNLESGSRGGQNMIDHIVKLDMAKEICMIQRSPIGRKIRQYFIEAEKRLRTWQAPDSYMIEDPVERANRWIQEQQAHQRKVKTLESQVAVKDQQLAELKPKASYYDIVLNSPNLLSMTEIAKDYGWSATRMNKYLNELGIQFKRGDIWLLYQRYAEQGYTSTKTHAHPAPDGNIHTTVHTYWTQKGRLFIYDTLKSHGILPVMEQPKQIELPDYDIRGLWE